jgi:hypothetical protein
MVGRVRRAARERGRRLTGQVAGDTIASALVRARLAMLVGGVAVAGAAAARFLRRRPADADVHDPNAALLKTKLAESRAVVDDRDDFDAGETPVDEADEAVAPDLGDRRKAVHTRARRVAEEMRRGSDS